MFVRIQWGSEEGSPEVLYECEGVWLKQSMGGEMVFVHILLPGRSNNSELTYEVRKEKGNSIYYMNDAGKTVDYLRWTHATDQDETLGQ